MIGDTTAIAGDERGHIPRDILGKPMAGQ